MYHYLLLITLVMIACVLCNKISAKLGIPTLLAFILLGMLFGSDGLLKIPFDNFQFAEQICSVALIFIMFYGGFGTNWKEARPVAAQAIALSSVGVVLTAGITGLFCRLVLRFGWWESFLIGSVISSTDAASVFSILRSKRLNLKHHTASLLEVESGSNDPFAYMLTMICLTMMGESVSGAQIIWMLLLQIVLGIVFAAAIAAATLWFLDRFQFAAAGFDAIFILAIAVLSYAAPAALGGNGYLSAYLVGLILGNRRLKNKKSLVHFFDGVTGLMQMLIFFLLGLLAFPSRMPNVLLPSLAIALFLTFIARPLAVAVLLSPFHGQWRQEALVSWAGLRGAASIVFAIMATIQSTAMENDLFHIVFCIVLFSILIQGSLLPWSARKLQMIDEHANVLKTFNDYSEEVPVQFIRLTVRPDHPWAGRLLRQVLLPPDTLVVLLLRNGERIVPNGDTVLLEGDILILSAKAAGPMEGIYLTEIPIDPESDWIGKPVSTLDVGPDRLIIMIQREDRIVIPRGTTIIQEGDLLVLNQTN